jgi:uncharacterized protein
MKIKIGVLSDTHLHQVTQDFRELCDCYFSNVDVVLHAGDFVSQEVIAFLSMKNLQGVHGNMDPQDVRVTLPGKRVLKLGPYRLGLIHGWGSPSEIEDRIRPEFDDVDVIVYGHSHRPVNHMRDGILFFNPGTATGHSVSGIRSIGIIEIHDNIHGELIQIPWIFSSQSLPRQVTERVSCG